MTQMAHMTHLDAAPAGEDIDQTDVARVWLADFGAALAAKDAAAVCELFVADCWWRDLYALTWDITALHNAPEFKAMLEKDAFPKAFGEIALDESFPVTVQAGGMLEVLYTFTTDIGIGRGVVRLQEDDATFKAWTISTSLQDLKAFPENRVTIADARKEEHNQPARPGVRKTWEQQIEERLAFRDSEPSVLILGAGHSGVFLAARLKQINVPTLVVDTYSRAGDNWRLRYSNLVLHDTKWWAQFPYMMYPDTWPLFTPKEMLADWIEAYVNFLQLNLWTDTRTISATYDHAEGRWTVELDRNGERRVLHPNHLVFATGNHGIPYVPSVPGAESFRGEIVHSSLHKGGEATRGKKIAVVGGASSACDVAQDAYENGAEVTLVQRSETYVLSQRNGVPIFHSTYYSETSPPIAEADLLASSLPMALVTQLNPPATRMIAEGDREMLDALEGVGFHTTLGPNDAGMMYMGLVRGGGYYIDKGAAQLIINGEIRLQRGEIDHFTETGVVYKDGTEESANIVVFCTGYSNMREATRPIVGDEIADQLALVWGLDDTGELRTTHRHSGFPKLWFMANGFQQSRIHSKHMAMMMKAIDEGLLDPNINIEKKKA